MKSKYDKKMIKAAILIVSDKGARGQREDKSGPLVYEALTREGYSVEKQAVVPDEEKAISQALVEWTDKDNIRLIITTGGTGVSPRDVTPEATKKVIKYEIPGMAEAVRAESLKKTPNAMLSRAVMGARESSIIINLPGSPEGARESLLILLPALGHALAKLAGDQSDCHPE